MILDKIVEKKKIRVDELKASCNFEELVKNAKNTLSRASFYEALKKPGLSIIGEAKKASPSKGLIKPDFDYMSIAEEYSKSVDAISVLTEEDFFLGSPKYLKEISGKIKTPLLRKDFIIDEIQIYEAKILGASAVLLIAAILDLDTMKKYIKITKEIGIDALVEVHDMEELEKTLEAGAEIIGINNRNLKTFDVSLETTLNIAKNIPEDKIVVSESGIESIEDIKYLKNAKIDAILVGESFMRTDNIIKKAQDFKKAFE